MTDRELLEENNKMLKEILSFVRKVDSAEYYGWNIRSPNKEVDCLI